MGNGGQISERLLAFAVGIVKLTRALPNDVAGRHMGGQLLRSGTSSAANYEEACAAESRADFIHKLQLSLKELRESRFWLQLVTRAEMLGTPEAEHLLRESEELCCIIARSVLTACSNKKSSTRKPNEP